nr:hypothetical protein [Proteomonas sp. NEIS-1375]
MKLMRNKKNLLTLAIDLWAFLFTLTRSTIGSFTAILLGFFLATMLSTLLGQTGDWGLLSSSLLVATLEVLSRILYTNKNTSQIYQRSSRSGGLIIFFNNVKIGLMYGLFVEAFKLGS